MNQDTIVIEVRQWFFKSIQRQKDRVLLLDSMNRKIYGVEEDVTGVSTCKTSTQILLIAC